MQAARTEPRGKSWLAVECAGQGLLLPLDQAGEIFAVGRVLPVPHTQPWFAGVANLRGGLHGVVDLAGFLGLRARPRQAATAARGRALLALNPSLGVNCALLVDRLAGLRNADELSARARRRAGASRAARVLPARAGAIPTAASGRKSNWPRWQAMSSSSASRAEAAGASTNWMINRRG